MAEINDFLILRNVPSQMKTGIMSGQKQSQRDDEKWRRSTKTTGLGAAWAAGKLEVVVVGVVVGGGVVNHSPWKGTKDKWMVCRNEDETGKKLRRWWRYYW